MSFDLPSTSFSSRFVRHLRSSIVLCFSLSTMQSSIVRSLGMLAKKGSSSPSWCLALSPTPGPASTSTVSSFHSFPPIPLLDCKTSMEVA